MIVERGLINIRPGEQEAFEAAFAQAQEVIAAAPGFQSVTLARGIESPACYLLLVEWERLEDHTDGFRNSPLFTRWRELIGPYFDGGVPPQVEHYQPVARR